MRIRNLEEEDAKAFLELNKKLDVSGYMLYDPGERQTTVEAQQKTISKLNQDESINFLVAEDDGVLTGFIAALRGKQKRKRHSAYLVLGVDADYRGKGIASKLFDHVFEWAENTGVTRLELTVIKGNEPAFNLYRKMGFVIEGEKVHSLMVAGKPVNEYYMYRLL